MAKYWTWGEIRTKVERDLDLEDETFISPEEMLGYGNEAVDEVERQIHNICEDYFLTRSTISLVSGQEAYDLPTNVYAMKLRGLVYRNGTSVYKMVKFRDWHKFEQYELEKTGLSSYVQYAFFVENTTAGNPQIVIGPTPNENGPFVKTWYIRNANELIDDDSVCDIPEAVNYIMQYIKVRIYEKDFNPNLQKAIADLEAEKQTTLTTLSSMIVDNSNEIEADLRLYDEMN